MRYHETSITVRFNEVDAYRVAWHGHYVAWMEVGRGALAERFGVGALQMADLGYLGPVVSLEVKYLRPARYGDTVVIRTGCVEPETATLEFVSEIVDGGGKTLARGRTLHALTDLDGVLQFHVPPALGERLERMYAWQRSS